VAELVFTLVDKTGFHVDDSEVTLNVCLGKEFDGGELFFRGVRCDKHVNGEARPEVGLTPKGPGVQILNIGRMEICPQHT